MAIAVHTATISVARSRRRALATAFVFCVVAAPASTQAADPVLDWNDIARQLIIPAFNPVQQTRAMAIVHVAIHDAVSAITGEYEVYQPHGAVPAGVTPEAAAIGAAYGALRGIVSDPGSLEAPYAASLASYGLSPNDPGLAFGQAVAADILALRQQDGAAQATFPYMPPNAGALGVWVPVSAAPSAQALVPGWGKVTPFVLLSGSQFRPEPPPALDSERYAKDYAEVMQLGADVGSTRTDEQTQIALFWRASPTALWNPILRRAIASRGLNLSTTARVAALFYLAAGDASVAVWEAKYFYNYWRPQAAIASGEHDGNSATAGDPGWRSLLQPTPPHPEYPSAHASNSGAMAAILGWIFGDAPGFVIEATSSQNAGFVRYWSTFSQGVDEVIDARVHSGIHFRFGDEAGARLGRQVARFVITHALRRIRP